MRFPVFARRANPSVEKPIQRKSKYYVTGEVEAGRADWVDPNDPKQGIICREMLYFGPKELPVEDSAGFDWIELPGVRFIDPNPKRNPAAMAVIRDNWEWNCEQTA